MIVDILGRPWKITSLSQEAFIKRFKDEYAGITVPLTREVIINQEDCTLGTVVHEMTHAYIASLCTHSANLTGDQQEEVYCELMALHGTSILSVSKKIYKLLRET